MVIGIYWLLYPPFFRKLRYMVDILIKYEFDEKRERMGLKIRDVAEIFGLTHAGWNGSSARYRYMAAFCKIIDVYDREFPGRRQKKLRAEILDLVDGMSSDDLRDVLAFAKTKKR